MAVRGDGRRRGLRGRGGLGVGPVGGGLWGLVGWAVGGVGLVGGVGCGVGGGGL